MSYKISQLTQATPASNDLFLFVDVDDTSTPPAGSGGSDKAVTLANLAAAVGGGGGFALTRTSVQTSNYTATAGQLVPVDTTSGSVTVTLPNAPATGTLNAVKMVTQGSTNTVTVACAGSDVFNKTGGPTTGTLTLLNQGLFMQYNGSGIWTVLSDDLPLAQTDLRYLTTTGGGQDKVSALGSVSGAQTLNLANGNVFTVTATGNITFTFSGATSGVACSMTLYLSEDGTGGRTFTWPGSVTWIGGTTPTLATAASALNVLVFETLNGGTTWYGSLLAEPPSYPLSSALGGTGTGSPAVNELLAGPTSGGSPLQSIASSGTAGEVLTDNGSSSLPSFQPLGTGGVTFPAYVAPAVGTLTDGSSVALNAATANDWRWTLGGSSHTLAAPSNPVNGQAITIAIKYSGSYTPLFNAIYDFGAGGAPTWTATSGKTDYVGFRYDSALNAGAGEWAYMGSVLGLTS